MSDAAHEQRIQEQFTRQSATFGNVPSHSAESSLAVLLELARPKPTDAALDVACGPGIVTVAFAPHVASIRGQDVVPAMVERARARAAAQNLSNAHFDVGDSNALPYADATFDLVVTRFSFHHFHEPLLALHELRRVCKPSGAIVVADVAPAPEAAAAYDEAELIRDPSHTHALTEAEFEALARSARLRIAARQRYGLPLALEPQLAASFPIPGGRERLRALFAADVGVDRLGIATRHHEGDIYYVVPVLVLRLEHA
ncbi:MAG TPA: methyltransferase domain-containing protein [Polyangiaceae bacterium]|nr:methyltransferase domain-containing protein [Polyangiaceae bacterium]